MKESAIQWRGPGVRRPSRGVEEELTVSEVTVVPSDNCARFTSSILMVDIPHSLTLLSSSEIQTAELSHFILKRIDMPFHIPVISIIIYNIWLHFFTQVVVCCQTILSAAVHLCRENELEVN